MKFYESIANYYEKIFPAQDSAEILQNEFFAAKRADILDVGCATGEISLGLSAANNITGIDIDEEMIKIAKSKKRLNNSNVNFYSLDMNKIEGFFGPETFDGILCLGNTIVHLGGFGEIEDFFKKIEKILKKGGQFIAQILNYDMIISKKISELPLIDNEDITFERYYDQIENSSKLNFRSVLNIKKENRKIENNIALYPAGKNEIERALQSAKFGGINFFSDIDRTAFDINNSMTLAFHARK